MSPLKNVVVPDEVVLSKIYFLRNQKVMLDRDLAELYDVKPIRLREQVKRNKDRFPENFMFQLTEEEVNNMVSQNAIPSKQALGGAFPYVFTEHGVLMLSNVLKSERALQMSIRIIEIFVKLRETLLLHKDVALLVDQVEKRMGKQDDKIELLFSYLSQFMEKEEEPRKSIGFKL
ncbi:ORF6N domain-containing protein [Pedobacter steynii]|uniref:ORF6N domain-containing protein n=1 Tax=Pedobacter steynii TaxID=430522 RepID=A0A1G9QZ32_9SPHI|nr:ORF6N domain-containing protein [Pedobacter steynii]NQX37940.1 ORF6N domain-containing protein [Pedobacter steynii]SDM16130.1 ORF6N domain-containing protein [Pedobacter steynii]